jgi:hypothetical protein
MDCIASLLKKKKTHNNNNKNLWKDQFQQQKDNIALNFIHEKKEAAKRKHEKFLNINAFENLSELIYL